MISENSVAGLLDMFFYEELLSDTLEMDMVGTNQNGNLTLETRKENLKDGEKPWILRTITEEELQSMSV